MPTKPLTALALRSLKPRRAAYKIADGGGLYLLINPNGSRLWRMAYRFAGKQRTLAIGIYPRVALVDARKAREAAKMLLADNRDPSAEKKQARRATRTGGCLKLSPENGLKMSAPNGSRATTNGSPRALSRTFSPTLEIPLLARSNRQNFSTCCARLKRVASPIFLAACVKFAVKFSVTRLRRDGRNVILPSIFGER